jgi:hypothetical protein
MILVLCEETDYSALWAADAMRGRGHAVKVVTGADLADAVGWQHRVGSTADCEIRLADGALLCSRDTGGVLNRLFGVPTAWIRRLDGDDREYALQEMHALYLSWLHALPGPVLNPPTPQGLCGNWRHISAWTALAVRAGLPVRPFCQESPHEPGGCEHAASAAATLCVIDGRAIGPDVLAAPFGAASVCLARAAGAPLLGIDFAPCPGGMWQMVGASVMPDLINGGDALVDALIDALIEKTKEK